MTLTPHRKILGALLCLLTPVAVAGPVSCHVTGVSGIDFGNLDAFGSGASVNGRIDYECYNDSGAERRVLLCAAIDGGVGAPTRIAPRTLAPPGGSPLLDYDLYWPDGVTVQVGEHLLAALQPSITEDHDRDRLVSQGRVVLHRFLDRIEVGRAGVVDDVPHRFHGRGRHAGENQQEE